MTSNCPASMCGSGVSVYLDGEINGTEASRIEALVLDGTVTQYSTVYFNSPGGSLFGGLDLRRTIRKYGFNTAVGRLDENGKPANGGSICMSACSLAYLGGVFRYFHDDDLFGVYRFYSEEPMENEGEVAQIVSAAIISFLGEMDIEPGFFVEMTKAGSQSMRLLDKDEMIELGIANNGFGPTYWTVTAPEEEMGASILYLKGERDTVYGVNKVLFFCSPSTSGMVTHIIFDPQGRADEARAMRAISLEIDGDLYPFAEFLLGESQIVNGWLNASFRIPPNYWSAIKEADQIEIVFQFSYDAPIFLGISGMSLDGAKHLMLGIESGCKEGFNATASMNYQRYVDIDFFWRRSDSRRDQEHHSRTLRRNLRFRTSLPRLQLCTQFTMVLSEIRRRESDLETGHN